MRFTCLAVAALAGCSFAGVRAPRYTLDRTTGIPSAIHCSDNGLLPAIDALGGAAAIAATGGGILLEHTSDDRKPEHFTRYYAGPGLVLAIIYFYSASFGNDRITRCSDLKDSASQVKPVVRPVEDDGPKKKPDDEIEIN